LPEKTLLNPDFKDILLSFIEEKVEFLVVGAYAMASLGVIRATGDLDLWVRPDVENSNRVWKALLKFGAPTGEISTKDFSSSNVVFQIGVAPCRIDILTNIDGVLFGEAWSNRKTFRVDNIDIPVIGKNDLIKNKKSTGRERDLLDVKELEKSKN
jgi:hypothetical protein